MAAVPSLPRRMAMTGAASALAAGLTVAQAVLLARIVVAVFLQHADLRAVTASITALAVVFAAKAAIAGLLEMNNARASSEVRSHLRRRLVESIITLGPSWRAIASPDAVVTAAGPGIESLDGYVTRALPALVAASIVPIVALGAIGLVDWQSLLVLLATLPLVPIFMALIGITTKRRMDREWATLSRLSGHFLDLLHGLTTLKVYGRGAAQVEAVRDGTDRYRRQAMATLRTAFLSGLALDLIATLSVALVAVWIGLRVDHGHITLGHALIVLLLAPEVYAPIRAAGAQHHATEEARSVLDACFTVLHPAVPADDLPRDADELPDADGEPAPSNDQQRDAGATSRIDERRDQGVADVAVRFDTVTLRYPHRGAPALVDVDLDVVRGAITVLSGPSGAGKSSLLALLLGFARPTQGHVRQGNGGCDIPTGPDADTWRSALAWVPQRPSCTQETVADEVRLGDAGIAPDDIESILALCQAPAAGVALGENGGWLSAGQRRRLALARAVARARAVTRAGGHPLVLLDEPSEDLDSRTEQVVAAVISSLAGEATVVIATHSPVLRSLADVEVSVVQGHTTSWPGEGDRVTRLPAPFPPVDGEDMPQTDVTAARSSKQVRLPLLRRALAETPAAQRALIAASALGGLAGLAGVALSATSVWLICRAAQHPNVQALAIAVVGVRTFALAKALCRYMERLAAHDGALRLLASVRARVFAALEPLAPAGLGLFRRGDLLRRFTTDVDGAQEALIRAVVPMAGAAATVAGAVAVVASVDPMGALVLASGAVLAGAVIPYLSRRAAGDGTERAATAGRRDELVTGLLDGLDELVAYGGAGRRVSEIVAGDASLAAADRRPNRAAAWGAAAAGTLSGATVAGLVATIVPAISSGRIPAIWAGVVAVTALVALDQLVGLPAAFAAFNRCLAGMRRVEEVLAAPAPIARPETPLATPSGPLGVYIRSLTLAPAIGAPPVVVGGELTVQPGERVAVIGPSGCGKSSLLAATLRLLPVRGGEIALRAEGQAVPVEQLAADAMAPLVAGSLQGDHVFAATLGDNLRLVAPRATDADLGQVAARVGLDRWVASLPNGWSTPAGPDGSSLSGGQRQRLLLARALLANPRILILDEPTAHVDADTETAIMADLLSATGQQTLIMATHHRCGLAGVDHVVQLRDAALVPAADVVSI